ncbi:MAG: hypothetical protein ACE5K4_12615 [Candidatus Hydrothermarchaeota archaeon]
MKKPVLKDSSFLRESSLLEEEDILGDLIEKKGPLLFLGRYSINEVKAVLNKRNFLHEARKRKLWPLQFELDSSEFPVQRLLIYCREKRPENVVVDLKIREGRFRAEHENFNSRGFSFEGFKFLVLEWLTLQNPLQSFSADRLPLPGQKYPGLGLGKKVLDVFVYLARLTGCDGILAFPAYFHNALLFSRYFHFLNPEKKAEVNAVKECTREVTFKQLAWIVYLECLRDRDDKVYEWKAEEMVFPLHKRLRAYFDSKEYRKRVREARKALRYWIDWESYGVRSCIITPVENSK